MELAKFDESIAKEIRTALDKDQLIVGFKRSVKKLVANEVEKVYVARNVKDENGAILEQYIRAGESKIQFIDLTNDKLGVACKKPFNVSCVAILKAE